MLLWVAICPIRKAHRVLGKAKDNPERAGNGRVDALVLVHGESVGSHRSEHLMPTTTTTTPRRLGALLLTLPLIVGLSVGLGACSTPDSTGRDGSSTPAPEGQQTHTFETFEDYQLAFADCMRGKGIDMEDPNNGGQSITQADDAFLEAADACQSEIGEPPAREDTTGNQGPSSETLREEHLEIAACLREHGVDVPDPAPGEDLAIPSDVPADAFDTCAPTGVMGSTGGN